MKWSHSRTADAAAGVLLLAAPASAMLRCNHVQVDGQKFDFEPLSGPHSVVTWQDRPPYMFNTTYTLDLCAPLKKSGDAPSKEQCPNFTRVCAIGREIDEETDRVSETIPIAGDLKNVQGGGDLDPKYTRLKTSDSSADAQKEGVRIVLNGGSYGGVQQRAIVEMVCDRQKTGLEGEWDPKDDKYEKNPDGEDNEGDGTKAQRKRAEGDDKGDDKKEDDGKIEHQFLKENASLIFDGYEQAADSKSKVLRLTWHTKYACEGLPDDERPDKGEHWGFFTWVFILLFLGTATYLIFGSWLNYNRYGARGWDLLPHGDTIRDIPYLLKDWTRRVLNTVQGSGSRGGYSAV